MINVSDERRLTASGSTDYRCPVPLQPTGAIAINEFAAARLLGAQASGEPFVVADGMLVLQVDRPVPARTIGAIASSGEIGFAPLMRRMRGQTTTLPFGTGADSLFLTTGRGQLVVSPRGGHFTILALQNDVLYLREAALYAFEESLLWENGRIPGGGEAGIEVVQLRGSGRCVFHASQPTFCVKLESPHTLFIETRALLGWIGRVVPRHLPVDPSTGTAYIECSGEGALILMDVG